MDRRGGRADTSGMDTTNTTTPPSEAARKIADGAHALFCAGLKRHIEATRLALRILGEEVARA